MCKRTFPPYPWSILPLPMGRGRSFEAVSASSRAHKREREAARLLSRPPPPPPQLRVTGLVRNDNNSGLKPRGARGRKRAGDDDAPLKPLPSYIHTTENLLQFSPGRWREGGGGGR